MKYILSLFIAVLFATALNAQNIQIGTFDGRSPCQELAQMLKEPAIPECIKIKWRLKLFSQSQDATSGTYELWGYIFRNESTQKGTWRQIRGTKANPDAIVYELDIPSRCLLYLQKADDNVLLFLDAEKNLLVGNRDFSYCLNRVPNK